MTEENVRNSGAQPTGQADDSGSRRRSRPKPRPRPRHKRPDLDEIDRLGWGLGFGVLQPKVWRSGTRCVVIQVVPARTDTTESLSSLVAGLVADGVISQTDDVVGVYLYTEWDAAVRALFDQAAGVARRPKPPLRFLSLESLRSLAKQVRTGELDRAEARATFFASTPITASGPSGAG